MSTPHFKNAPVVETVLGVQFAPLTELTSAHFGWFWKSYLSDDWTRVAEAPSLPDQFERFGDARLITQGARLTLRSEPEPERIQFVHRDDDRVIQIQRSRFLYNWRKRSGQYPRYHQRLQEFSDHLSRFRQFTEDASLGAVLPNQWEVTYINHIPRGELWHAATDWHRVIPKLIAPWSGFGDVHLGSLSSEWHHEISPKRGRLHVAIRHARADVPSASGDELLVVQLTARGPLRDDTEIEAGLNCGHDAIVHGFAEVTSSDAQRFWQREI